MVSERDFYPPKGVREQARRGILWYERGHGGEGLVRKTIVEAKSIARGDKQSVDKIRRMRAWFARHSVDKQSDSWREGTADKPSPSQVAWALWGGDAGKTWSEDVMRRLERA